jgi:hypothetical protein
MINLYEFVSSNDFIDHLPKDTTYTVFTDGIKRENTEHTQWFSFIELFEQFQTITPHEHIICIATSISSEDIKTINNILQLPCTWINCNP